MMVMTLCDILSHACKNFVELLTEDRGMIDQSMNFHFLSLELIRGVNRQ